MSNTEIAETHNILNIITPGFLGDIMEEVAKNEKLARLLGQEYGGTPGTAQQQLSIEYAVCRLLAGDEAAIAKAKEIFENRNIPVCKASCELLAFYGINPIGVVAIAYARGVYHDWDRNPARYKIQTKAGLGRWFDVNYIRHNNEEECISMVIPIEGKVTWMDADLSLNFSRQMSFPETILSAIIGKPATDLIGMEIFDTYVVNKIKGDNDFLLKTAKPCETLGWLVEQDYPTFSWVNRSTIAADIMSLVFADNFNADIMSLVLADDFDIDKVIDHLKTMKN